MQYVKLRNLPVYELNETVLLNTGSFDFTATMYWKYYRYGFEPRMHNIEAALKFELIVYLMSSYSDKKYPPNIKQLQNNVNMWCKKMNTKFRHYQIYDIEIEVHSLF